MKQRSAPTFFAKEVTGARRFYRDLAASSDGALKIVTGGVEQCGADYCINRGSFPFTTIEYVSRGHGALEMAGEHHILGSGSVFAYKKGVPHRITSDARGSLYKYFVAFTGSDAARLLRDCGLASGQHAQVSPADSLNSLFEELVWAGPRADAASEDYCHRILECLAVRIHASIATAPEREPASFRKYQACRSYIEANFLGLHSAKEIAESCDVSEVYLCHLFRRYDHQTPYRVLTRLKINHAAALIEQSDMLVKQAAAAVGYADQFHFSRVFRDVLGVPPSDWRRMNARPVGGG
jgi:AraC-like DNA-binding protein